MSIDDVVTEKAVSFVARNVSSITSGPKNSGSSIKERAGKIR